MAQQPADHHRAGPDSPRPIAHKPDRRTREGLGDFIWILVQVTLMEMDMSDHSELKRLAESFPDDLDWDSNTGPFFNGPSGESLGGDATGFYCVYGKPFRLEGEDYDYDGPTYVEACHSDFAKFMVAARAGVLALIADLEMSNNVGRALGETLGSVVESRDALVRVVDQLKAAVDEWQDLAERRAQRMNELAQAANAARDEAEALRNLASELRGSAKCYNVHHSKAEQHGISEPCKALARIDAAMAKGKVNV